MTLKGIDVSHHQGVIDWPLVARSGQMFAWAKASEGRSFRDSRFAANWAAIKAAGMVRGAYHFLRSDSDPAVQARHFVDVVGDFTGSMAALDVESSGESRPTGAQARAFVAEWRRLRPGHPIVIYTGRWYWRDTIGNPPGADLGPLWHSAYTSTPGTLYGGWTRFTFWQYTSKGSVPGVAGNCDLNTFYGDRAALSALCGRTLEDDMPLDSADLDAIGNRVRAVLNEGTGTGQATWAGTSKATLHTAQQNFNKLNALAIAVAALNTDDLDEVQLAALLADHLDDNLAAAVSDAIVAKLPDTAITKQDVASAVRETFAAAFTVPSTG